MSKIQENLEKVRVHLRESGLRVGDRLPGERALAEVVGLGRGSLRSALETLETDGVLTRRPQSGTYLAAIPLPSGRGASIALVAPLNGTSEPVRVAESSWIHRVVSAIERTATSTGIHLSVINQSPLASDPCAILDIVRDAAAGGARGVILLHPLGSRVKIGHALAILHDLGVDPVIVSSRSYPGMASQVYFDSGWGAYLATRHLLHLGHRRIGFAGAPVENEWVRERHAGYRHALEAAEAPFDDRWAWLPDGCERMATEGDGANALSFWQSLPATERPTGIVCGNDLIASGVLAAAEEVGLSVPGDLSVVGFDNDPASLLLGLSTIERPTEALGETVARVVLERLAAGTDAEAVTVRLRPVLIERRTSGPPRARAVRD